MLLLAAFTPRWVVSGHGGLGHGRGCCCGCLCRQRRGHRTRLPVCLFLSPPSYSSSWRPLWLPLSPASSSARTCLPLWLLYSPGVVDSAAAAAVVAVVASVADSVVAAVVGVVVVAAVVHSVVAVVTAVVESVVDSVMAASVAAIFAAVAGSVVVSVDAIAKGVCRDDDWCDGALQARRPVFRAAPMQAVLLLLFSLSTVLFSLSTHAVQQSPAYRTRAVWLCLKRWAWERADDCAVQ